MARQEIQHNTPEQVLAYLNAALAIVAELELADELREPAFVKAVDLLAAKQIMLDPVAPGFAHAPAAMFPPNFKPPH